LQGPTARKLRDVAFEGRLEEDGLHGDGPTEAVLDGLDRLLDRFALREDERQGTNLLRLLVDGGDSRFEFVPTGFGDLRFVDRHRGRFLTKEAESDPGPYPASLNLFSS
jgi:hypothetical protein